MEKKNTKEKEGVFKDYSSLLRLVGFGLLIVTPLAIIGRRSPESESGNLEKKVESVVTDSVSVDTVHAYNLEKNLADSSTSYIDSTKYFHEANDGTKYVNNSRR